MLGQKRWIDTKSRPAAKTLRGSAKAFLKERFERRFKHPSEWADSWEEAPYCKACGDRLGSTDEATHYCCPKCAEELGL